jgi:ABC-2 type transport system ATP-binding protein
MAALRGMRNNVTAISSSSGVIEARRLTKRYGGRTVVDDLSFCVQPGTVTGLLGPNGAGKSTTMRMLLGLAAPSSGTITIGGRPMAELDTPARHVGALLDANAVHPGRTAFDHLLAFAEVARLDRRRINEVLMLAGLGNEGTRRTGTFSLGMKQRLGIATSLLGDPQVLVLDEPLNGLDPEGILWMRTLMHSLAREGRTVLFSSHLMSEMQLTADDLIVIAQGKLITQAPLQEIMHPYRPNVVVVRAAAKEQLKCALSLAGFLFEENMHGAMVVQEAEAHETGELAARDGIALEELSDQHATLEDAFLQMTRVVPDQQRRRA